MMHWSGYTGGGAENKAAYVMGFAKDYDCSRNHRGITIVTFTLPSESKHRFTAALEEAFDHHELVGDGQDCAAAVTPTDALQEEPPVMTRARRAQQPETQHHRFGVRLVGDDAEIAMRAYDEHTQGNGFKDTQPAFRR